MIFAQKILAKLFSTSAAGLYLILFAFAIGAATFIENDFGTSAAQKVVFKTHWFELLLVLFGICLMVNIVRFKLIRQKKWAIFLFHAAMIVILLGAGVTRYFGSEGMMSIREGTASDTFLSSETYLQFQVEHAGKKYRFEEPVLFASLGANRFERNYLLGGQKMNIHLQDFIPNPVETLVDDPAGTPVLKVVIGGMGGREEYLVKYLDKVNIQGTLFNFGNPEDPNAFNIKFENDELSFVAATPFLQMVMATQTRDSLAPGIYHPLKLRSLYSNGAQSFVFGDFRAQARTTVQEGARKMSSTSTAALRLQIQYGDASRELIVNGNQGVEGQPVAAVFNENESIISVAYGAKRVRLPFSIALRDFIMERYPGTNSASSYASEVTLIDPRENIRRDQRIYMNHILDYDGYRFFQSSYDQDELGTYLSVNYDAPGTILSYIGYFLLTVGMILTLFSAKSRFLQLAGNIKRLREGANPAIWILLLGLTTRAWGGSPVPQHIVQADHADKFGHLLMQDNQGRLKPMNTFAGELLRKLTHKESMFGLSPEQIVLSMAADPEAWYDVPMIRVGKHEKVRELLGVQRDMASYRDFFDARGEYKLRDAARDAFNAPPRERGVFEKEIVKIDERLNICSMIFSGSFMKVFPVPGDPTNTWKAPTDVPHQHGTAPPQGGTIIDQFYPMYIPALQASLKSQDHRLVDRMVAELNTYQQKYGGAILPTSDKVNAELLLNKLNIFNRLGKLYGLLGLLFLGILFTSVFKPNAKLRYVAQGALGLLALGFLFHTIGLGLRWYVSGRAPWSNGYESMIYIGWTTVLAGLLFSRKSYGGLTATAVLAATIMMVAGLSWLDPEITPLVPVLKSYWLTIHVSLEAGSYGFLVLGAIIGLLNLMLMAVANRQNGEKVYRIIKEMSYTSEMTLIGGLFMLSVGTYLGGVWANESWGRYWGWDAKETWALVTILVYSFILHMRLIPGLRGLYAYNAATLFGWASVAMTYFGVNYYLSGLHSYAAGDPVPVPDFVYYIVVSLIVISLVARWRYTAYHKK